MFIHQTQPEGGRQPPDSIKNHHRQGRQSAEVESHNTLIRFHGKDHWERVYQKHSSNEVGWIEADVTKHSFNARYDVWHDRAVFHFLTEAEERKGYLNSLDQALRRNGHLIIATFGLDAPPKCSGLSVVRYSPESLQGELGDKFKLVETNQDNHVTPSGVTQNFIFCRFIKQAWGSRPVNLIKDVFHCR